MKKKNNKRNFALTVCGLLGASGIANAQQVKQEISSDVKQETILLKQPVAPSSKAEVKPEFKIEMKPEVKKVEAKKSEVKVEAKPEVKKVEEPKKVEAKKPEVKVETKPEVKKIEESKKVEVKVESKPEVKKVEEPKKVESKKEEKLLISKHFSDRLQLVEKYGKSKGLIMGVFPGSVATVDTASYMARYLPFANYLTVGANELISFAPELDVKKLKDKASKGKYDLLYVNAEVAVIAVKNGYEPLAQRSEKIVSVILTKKNSTISKVQDLSTSKVGAVPQAMVTTLARARFKRDNVNVNFINGGLTGQKELILGLDNGLFDGIVVRKETADELIAKDVDKYKVSLILEEAPGFILLGKKELSAFVKDNLAKSLYNLTVDNANDKVILNGLDGKSTGFSKIVLKDIESFENKIKIVE